MSTELWIAIGVLVLLALAYVLTLNSMIAMRNRVDEAWSGVDVQLKRRHDLVPNLVEAVRGYARHERETLERITEVRAEAMRARAADAPGLAAAEGRLTQALTDLRGVAEGYPQLRATENFQLLQRDLAEVEDEIQASRRIYNSSVNLYNTQIQTFPNSIVARLGNMTRREFFEIADQREREPVRVGVG